MALPVNFDPNAAIRIYNAVRKVEAGDRDQKPLTFERVIEQNPKTFKLCRFSGAWPIGSSKVVSVNGNTAATLSVSNLYFPITATISESFCSVSKAQGSWLLVSVPLQTATAVSVTSTATALVVTSVSTSTAKVVTGVTGATTEVVIGVSAVLDTVTCDIDVTLTKASVNGLSSVSTATITFVSSVATATSVVSQSTSLIQFLKIKDS
jgi:hypothetical protein